MKRGLFLIFALVIGGCVPSIHQLYTAKDVIYDPALVGTWKEKPDSNDFWKFEKSPDSNSYKLTVLSDDKTAEFSAVLCRFSGLTFIDIFPSKFPENTNDYYKLHFFPCHTFIKVEQISPDLKFSMMDPDKLGKHLQSDPNAIRHEKADNNLIITADTQALQKFMVKNASKDWVFGKPATLKRVDPNS